MSHFTTRPAAIECAPYYERYIALVPAGHNPPELLGLGAQQLRQQLAGLTEEQGCFAYAPGKWTLKEMLVHVIDTERIFAYRALRIARGDQTPLPGFEQDDYVPASGANERSLPDILAEYDAVRAATLSLLQSFGPRHLSRAGTASGQPVSVRALSFILAGHEAHHLHILQQRYLPLLAA